MSRPPVTIGELVTGLPMANVHTGAHVAAPHPAASNASTEPVSVPT